MDKLFDIEILTPDKKIYSGKISSLIAPAELGYLGVLANHAPLMTTLSPGKVTFKKNSGEWATVHSTGNGFLEVFKNNVTLLLDSVA